MITSRQLFRKLILDIWGGFSVPKVGVHILNGHMICKGIPNDTSKEYFSYQLKKLSRYVSLLGSKRLLLLFKIEKRQL